jgi:hypothetical protein
MEKFEEKKIVNILNLIGLSFFLLFLISVFLMVFNSIFLIGFISLPVSALFIILASSLSNKGKYSEKFIHYMYGKINNCNTLMELKECLSEFEDLAIKDGMYDLKYPVDLRRIHEKLIFQIEILEKQKN